MASIKMVGDTFEVYKKWVMNNPTHAGEMETFVKWLSYLIAGKVNKSPILSEMIYSLSNLFTLYNDILIKKNHGEDVSKITLKERLKLWLTILHYSEVFLEIGLKNKWGDKGKWGIATIVQIIRCFSNLILIYQYSEIPLLQPPIPVLQREKLTNENLLQEHRQEGFVLKRSGRVIRKVEAALPVSLRNWKPIDVTILRETSTSAEIESERLRMIKFAETLYAIKPLAHLGTIACFGSETWKQWFISLLLDLYNLHLYKNTTSSLSYDQRVEIHRRKLNLILYMLRSPMYQRYTSAAIGKILTSMSNNIPLIGFICRPILQHLPDWQNTYFYMWPC